MIVATFGGIAVVTATLRYILSQAAAAVPNTVVRVGPPRAVEPGGGPEVSIFLYQVRQSAEIRNADLPTRNADGQLIVEPTITLELDYVLSFCGTGDTSESELLLGAAIATFHTNPIVTESTVTDALSTESGLEADGLSYPVRIVPLSLSTDERSKLWSGFFQVPYRLSAEYRVRTGFVPGQLPVPPTP